MGIFTRKVETEQPEPRSEVIPEAPIPGSGVLPPSRYAVSQFVTVEEALSLPAVFRAVSLLSNAIASLSVDVKRGVETVPAPSWISRPDIKMSQAEFLEQTTSSLALHGEAFWRIVRDSPADKINALVVLDPTKVSVNDDGTFGYQGKTLRGWQVEHLKYLSRAGQPHGTGPIQANQRTLRGALDLQGYSAMWFREGATPDGILTSDQPLSAEDAARYRAQWEAREGRGIAVFGKGIHFEAITLTPEQALWTDAQEFYTREVARMYGVPAHLLLAATDGGSQTYANISQSNQSFMQNTLRLYTETIEEALSNLLPRTQVARMNLDGVLRADTNSRYEAYKTGIEAGVITPNEARETERLSPLPGGSAPAPKEATPNE